MDPLDLDNIDTNGVSTALPRLATDDYHLKIADLEKVENKNQTGYNLKVTFTTQEEARTPDGDTVQPGFKVLKWYPLQQSDNPDAPDFKRDLRVLINAGLGLTDADEAPPLGKAVAMLKGRSIVAKVKYKEDEQYGPSNEVGFLRPLD